MNRVTTSGLEILGSIVFYCAIACALTWPMVFHINEVVIGGGELGASVGASVGSVVLGALVGDSEGPGAGGIPGSRQTQVHVQVAFSFPSTGTKVPFKVDICGLAEDEV